MLTALATLLCGCQEQDTEYGEVPRPIELQAAHPDQIDAVVRSQGAGSITKWRDTPIGLVAMSEATNQTMSWDAKVNSFGNVNIAMTPSYPPDDKLIHITAYYPTSGVLANDFTTVTYTGLDGTDDLMMAPKRSARSTAPFSSKEPLKFSHLLTQLMFEVSSPEGELFPNVVTIKSIIIEPTADQPFYTQATVDLTDASPVVNFVEEGGSLSSLPLFVGNYIATTQKTTIGALLLPPSTTGGYGVDATVTLSVGDPIKLPTIKAAFQPGVNYRVRLTLSGTSLSLSLPEILPWITVPVTPTTKYPAGEPQYPFE